MANKAEKLDTQRGILFCLFSLAMLAQAQCIWLIETMK